MCEKILNHTQTDEDFSVEMIKLMKRMHNLKMKHENMLNEINQAEKVVKLYQRLKQIEEL